MHFIYRHIGKTPAQTKERDHLMEKIFMSFTNMRNNMDALEKQVAAIKDKAKNKSEK